jgi:hypothetical protein
LSGTNLTNPSGGTLAHPGSQGSPSNGQGIGATASSSGGSDFTVAQYALTLSLSSSGGFSNSEALTAALVDAQNNAYAATQDFVWRSLNNPSAGSPSWYRPSPGTSGGANSYDADVASVVASNTEDSVGTVTAISLGQAIIEVFYPTFDFASASVDPEPSQAYGNPVMGIYAQVIVTVIS